MRRTQYVVLLTVVAALSATAADDTAERLGQATTVFNKLTASGHGIGPETIASADCIAVIPGFKKGAVVVGVGYWGNGKSAHEDPNAKIIFYGQTKGAFAGFGLDGATLKPDESSNKALYGKTISNGEIIEGAATPPAAQTFVSKLAQPSSR